MVEGVGETLPSIISTTIAMVVLSIVTLFVARRTGVSEIHRAASRESERLVAAQEKRIALLEVEVKELQEANADKDKIIKQQSIKIDALEGLIAEQQLQIKDLQARV